jgi:hypothetical protein
VEKPTAYLDTNIISAYWYEGEDIAAAARRFHTRERWNAERKNFAVYVSHTTVNELRAGTFRRQSDCLRMARALPLLSMTRSAKRVLDRLLKSRLIPETKPGDALQLAVSAAHEVDYLLTWNYAHLANPVAQMHLEAICRSLYLRAPLLVSPETVPQLRLGQAIHRRS